MELDQIRSEHDIDGAVALALRKRAKLPQHKFWPTVGVKQSGGCLCEKGKSPISEPVKKLIYAIYVAGLVLDSSTPEGAAQMAQLAELQAAAERSRRPRKKSQSVAN
jgi:hypothetical protein